MTSGGTPRRNSYLYIYFTKAKTDLLRRKGDIPRGAAAAEAAEAAAQAFEDEERMSLPIPPP